MLFSNLKDILPVRRISAISGISSSTVYYKPSVRRVRRLPVETENMIVEMAGERPTYGYRRIWAILRNKGIHLNQKTVRKVLKMHSLSLPASRHKGRTESRKLFKPTGPDQLWETDITYIPAESGMTYLMCVKDCFSKEWQGYNYANSCMASDAIGSVEDAVMRTFDGDVPEGLVLRVDNGPQYQSGNFRRAMKLLGMKLEYIQKHTPEDNGNIESFHNSIKTDYFWPNEFADIYEARKMVEYAFNDYNQVRPHSSVMYLPPSEFRRRWESSEEFRVEYAKFLASVKRKTGKYGNKIKEVEANGI